MDGLQREILDLAAVPTPIAELASVTGHTEGSIRAAIAALGDLIVLRDDVVINAAALP